MLPYKMAPVHYIHEKCHLEKSLLLAHSRAIAIEYCALQVRCQ